MLIEIKDMEKSYGEKILFDKINLQIPENQFVVVYGPSGSGKSTLLNIIGMIDDYDKGSYYLFGKFAPIVNSKKSLLYRRNKISYLFQNFALIEDESIEQNLKTALFYTKLTSKKKREKIREVLNQVNIAHPLKTKVFRLSGGEKQRVALARALLKKSELILADEPTGSLDIENRNIMLKLLSNEVTKGKTVIIVTHDPFIRKISDYVIELDGKGAIVNSGPIIN